MFSLNLRVVPYDCFGITLWSVKDQNGFIYYYCDTKKQANDHIKDSKDNLEYYPTALKE